MCFAVPPDGHQQFKLDVRGGDGEQAAQGVSMLEVMDAADPPCHNSHPFGPCIVTRTASSHSRRDLMMTSAT